MSPAASRRYRVGFIDHELHDHRACRKLGSRDCQGSRHV